MLNIYLAYSLKLSQQGSPYEYHEYMFWTKKKKKKK